MSGTMEKILVVLSRLSAFGGFEFQKCDIKGEG
jgi:hypothetical protein